MCITHDDQFLFAADEESCLFVFDVRDRQDRGQPGSKLGVGELQSLVASEVMLNACPYDLIIVARASRYMSLCIRLLFFMNYSQAKVICAVTTCVVTLSDTRASNKRAVSGIYFYIYI